MLTPDEEEQLRLEARKKFNENAVTGGGGLGPFATDDDATRAAAGLTFQQGAQPNMVASMTPTEFQPPPAPAPVQTPVDTTQPTPIAPLAPKPIPTPGGGGGGSRPVSTAGEALAHGAEKTAQEGQLQTIQAETGLNQRKAEAEGVQAKMDREAFEARTKATDEAVAKANDYLSKRTEEAQNFKIRDEFEGRPAARIAAALMRGLGAYAAARGGGENEAGKILDAAAHDYRQKQVLKLEQLNKGVADATEKVKMVRMEADAKESGFWKGLALQRAENMSKFGADQAAIEGDKTYQDALLKSTTLERQWQTGLVQHAEQQKLQASEIARNYAGAAKERAEAEKARAEAAAGPKENGRAAGVQIQKATLAEHGAAAIDTIDRLAAKGVTLTKADRAKIQDNAKEIQGTEHMNPLLAKLGRSTVLARSPYEGLSPEKQELANAYEILAQKGAGITSPSHAEEEMKHARSMFDLMAPGDEESIRAQKMDYARGIIGAAKGLGGKYTSIAAKGAEEGRASAPSTDIAGAKAWLQSPAARANPAKAAAWAKRLKELGAL